jgi:hypothetical protein
MEALMDRRSFTFKPTDEDRLTIRKWKWRFAGVYGAVLLMLALMVAALPRHKPDTASNSSAAGLSAARIIDGRATP